MADYVTKIRFLYFVSRAGLMRLRLYVLVIFVNESETRTTAGFVVRGTIFFWRIFTVRDWTNINATNRQLLDNDSGPIFHVTTHLNLVDWLAQSEA